MGIVRPLRLWGIICVLAVSILLYGRGHAQSDTGALNLTTSPLPISLTAKPGETITTELRVKNSGTKTEVLKVGLMKFSAVGEEGKPQLDDRQPGDDYFDWVSFSENQFVAQPNEWKSITMTVAVPKTAALGYYYAVTFSRANPETAIDKNAQVRGGTATLVLLDVLSPNAKRQAKLTDFHTTRKIYEFLPVTFVIKLANTGNIHLAPSGTIYIKRGKQQIDTIPVNTTKGNILPKSSRVFTVQWDDGYPVYKTKEAGGTTVLKNGQPVMTLHWDNGKLGKLRFGKYTANLLMTYDDGTRDVPLEASVSFWVVPWRLIIGIILVPLIPALLVYFIMRRRFKKKLAKHTAPQTSQKVSKS